MTDFKVPAGETLEIDLRRKRKPKEQPVKRDDERQGGVSAEGDPTRYVFRDHPQIIFLDLGTRLRSVPASEWKGDRSRAAEEVSQPVVRDDYFDEYVEIEYERAAPVRLASPTLSEVNTLDRRLLGSRALGGTDALDPLGQTPANRTGRQLYNCMPLLHDARWLYAVIGVNDKSFKLSADEGERPREWERRGEAAGDSQEQWNELNLEALIPFGSGLLKPKGTVKSLRVVAGDFSSHGLQRAVGAYEEFDTEDNANFKVTSEASFDAATVPLKLSNGAPIRVYLKPRFLRYELTTSNLLAPLRWDGRVPVYPDLFVFRGASTQPEVDSRAMCAVRRSPIGSAYYDANPPDEGTVGFLSWPSFTADSVPPTLTPAGALAAILAQGSKVYYVWRRTARALDFAHDENPYAGGVILDTPCP